MPTPRKKSPAKKKAAPVAATAVAARSPDCGAANTCEAVVAGLGEATVITETKWEKGGAKILFANAAFCRLTGYSADELVGKNTRLLHGTKTDFTVLRLGRRDNQQENVGKGEGWLARRDGSPFFAQWDFSELHCADQPCLVGIYRDQSEFKRLRDALMQSQKLDTVGLLASGVAHDFNNLLSVINGYCEIMSAKIAGVPAAQKDLQEIHRAGLKASAIARQILEFSRRQETEVKVINFNTLIREIADIIRRVAGDEITVELRLSSDLGNARIDPTHFQQVLLNLCFNARDAMTAGGKLTIRTANHKVSSDADRRAPGMHDGLYAVMRVSDTGQGMDSVVLNSIFEPFFTTKPHGTGLGLSTVQGIVRQNDGFVSVDSKVGAGTTFEIYLPETPEPEQTLITKLGNLPAVRGSETLLILEQDEILRKMIAGILSADGYRVADFSGPEDAAEFVAKNGPAQSLLLAHCGTKAGAALARKLYANNRGLRVISTSAETPRKTLPEFPPRAMAHLPKPFALSTLINTVRSLLDNGSR
ncbi:ATP-binding protein [Oleiharenicola lentus]|uniref:ATP-binding response regulator n=1 Tax=Oleiharenicola lentus TaxID=2508720 RepID=UPI003F67C2BB